MRRTPLKTDPEKQQAFIDRGRRKSAVSLTRSRNPKTRRKPISEASPAQRVKAKRSVCAACGQPASRYRAIDPAHIVSKAAGGCDHPDCVTPLCRTTSGGCHRAYDDGKLDLLPHLTLAEQAHAASHIGIVGAYRRTTNDRTVVQNA